MTTRHVLAVMQSLLQLSDMPDEALEAHPKQLGSNDNYEVGQWRSEQSTLRSKSWEY